MSLLRVIAIYAMHVETFLDKSDMPSTISAISTDSTAKNH